jgi:phenylalanyl-tRNA synthetase beta chain
VSFKPVQHPALHPGQTAQIYDINGEVCGLLCMLHPTLEKQFGFDNPVFLFEINQDAVLERIVPKFSVLSKFPTVRRDLAVIVEADLPANAIIDCIHACNEPVIRDVQIFDIYRGQGVTEGFKSVALSLILQDFSQTLTESEIDAIFCKVLESLVLKLNAKLRE